VAGSITRWWELFFRFHDRGNPGGDITRASIIVKEKPLAAVQQAAIQPGGGTVVEGSRITFSASAADGKTFQWYKDGNPIAGATGASCQIDDLKPADAGMYSVVVDLVSSENAVLRIAPREPLHTDIDVPREPYWSPTPRQVFSQTLAEQEKELKTNVLMLRFAESRKKLAADPYRPAYHFTSPESMMNDPNGPCFWQGHWHLFYQVFPPDAFPDLKDRRERLLQAHWGHAITDDWVHWRDLPYAIYPGIEKVSASGGTLVEKDRVVAFYPGFGAGQMVAIAKDPLLLNWEKLPEVPVHSPSGDSCIWKEEDTYYGLASADCLVSSKNLIDWTNHGAFLEGNPFPLGDAVACPSFLPIGDKYILLSFSHTLGGEYLLGDYDKQRHKFIPYEHGLFNHGTVAPGGVHAPTGVTDGKGGVIAIHNINDGRHTEDWDQLMSLAQHLTLGPDKRLRIEHRHVGEIVLPANKEIVLDAVQGNALELQAEIDPKDARWVQLNVLRSPNAEELTSITFYNYDRPLAFWYHTRGVACLDGSRSSTLPDAWPRPPEEAVLERGGEPLRLRVFVDHSVVEVFVNEKLYLAMRVYPGRKDSLGVSLRAHGQDAVLKSLDAWQMTPIWPHKE
jgi:beta-fructofuranosidase